NEIGNSVSVSLNTGKVSLLFYYGQQPVSAPVSNQSAAKTAMLTTTVFVESDQDIVSTLIPAGNWVLNGLIILAAGIITTQGAGHGPCALALGEAGQPFTMYGDWIDSNDGEDFKEINGLRLAVSNLSLKNKALGAFQGQVEAASSQPNGGNS